MVPYSYLMLTDSRIGALKIGMKVHVIEHARGSTVSFRDPSSDVDGCDTRILLDNQNDKFWINGATDPLQIVQLICFGCGLGYERCSTTDRSATFLLTKLPND